MSRTTGTGTLDSKDTSKYNILPQARSGLAERQIDDK
jgi:hypothetical protein